MPLLAWLPFCPVFRHCEPVLPGRNVLPLGQSVATAIIFCILLLFFAMDCLAATICSEEQQ